MHVLTSAWYLHGACRNSDLDTEHWFHHNPASPTSRKAKAICKACPVREKCLQDALSVPDTHGIWGGLDQYERSRLSTSARSLPSSRT